MLLWNLEISGGNCQSGAILSVCIYVCMYSGTVQLSFRGGPVVEVRGPRRRNSTHRYAVVLLAILSVTSPAVLHWFAFPLPVLPRLVELRLPCLQTGPRWRLAPAANPQQAPSPPKNRCSSHWKPAKQISSCVQLSVLLIFQLNFSRPVHTFKHLLCFTVSSGSLSAVSGVMFSCCCFL